MATFETCLPSRGRWCPMQASSSMPCSSREDPWSGGPAAGAAGDAGLLGDSAATRLPPAVLDWMHGECPIPNPLCRHNSNCTHSQSHPLTPADFAMSWQLSEKAEPRMAAIVTAAKGAQRLVLATDPDREGEAISWHLLQELLVRGGAERGLGPLFPLLVPLLGRGRLLVGDWSACCADARLLGAATQSCPACPCTPGRPAKRCWRGHLWSGSLSRKVCARRLGGWEATVL